jgi:hypothetical protein
MKMDPVVLLAEELRNTETRLRAAVRRYELDHSRANGEAVNALLNAVKSLYRELSETAPSSVLGAGELVRLAAQRLPFSLARYADHFHEVADRLGSGRREHADLIWLRAMRAALRTGSSEQEAKAAPLLSLAIAGAARPVVIFRHAGAPEAGAGLSLSH